jgi:prepilin-type N-terminal cleavage/methylation domain-containing protein
MQSNRGFSLIELMVVISILAILVAGSGVSLHLASYSNTERVAKEIDSALSKLQLETMSQGNQNHYLAIEWDMTEKVYYICKATSSNVLTEANWASAVKTITNKKKLASESIIISYSNQTDGSNSVLLRDVNSILLLSFIPSTGAFQSSSKQILIASDSKTTILHVVSITGNHYIE